MVYSREGREMGNTIVYAYGRGEGEALDREQNHL